MEWIAAPTSAMWQQFLCAARAVAAYAHDNQTAQATRAASGKRIRRGDLLAKINKSAA